MSGGAGAGRVLFESVQFKPVPPRIRFKPAFIHPALHPRSPAPQIFYYNFFFFFRKLDLNLIFLTKQLIISKLFLNSHLLPLNPVVFLHNNLHYRRGFIESHNFYIQNPFLSLLPLEVKCTCSYSTLYMSQKMTHR